MRTIQFTGEENWTVEELQAFLRELNVLYSRLYILDQLGIDKNIELSNLLDRPIRYVPSDEKLLIDFIEIHSPSLITLKGKGKIIKQMRLLLQYIIEIPHHIRMNELEVMKKWNERMRELDYSKEEIRAKAEKIYPKFTNPGKKTVKFMYKKRMTLQVSDDE